MGTQHHRITALLERSLQLPERNGMLSSFLKELAADCGADVVLVTRQAHEEGLTEVLHQAGPLADLVPRVLRTVNTVSGWARHVNKAQVFQSLQEDPRARALHALGIRAEQAVAIPLFAHGGPLGVLEVIFTNRLADIDALATPLSAAGGFIALRLIRRHAVHQENRRVLAYKMMAEALRLVRSEMSTPQALELIADTMVNVLYADYLALFVSDHADEYEVIRGLSGLRREKLARQAAHLAAGVEVREGGRLLTWALFRERQPKAILFVGRETEGFNREDQALFPLFAEQIAVKFEARDAHASLISGAVSLAAAVLDASGAERRRVDAVSLAARLAGILGVSKAQSQTAASWVQLLLFQETLRPFGLHGPSEIPEWLSYPSLDPTVRKIAEVTRDYVVRGDTVAMWEDVRRHKGSDMALALKAVVDGHARDRDAGQDLLSGLTPREIQVLRCLAHGLSNQEIAERLVIQRDTVRIHVSHILQKLAVTDRTKAALMASNLGLLVRGAGPHSPQGLPAD